MIKENYQPSAIAIACNTLSAVYPLTPFAKNDKITYEIISSGRYLINQQRRREPDYPVFVIATPTTVWSGAYDMNDADVMHVSGANLASQIECDYEGDDVKETLAAVFNKIKTLSGKKDIVLFLGCTHYGYIENIFLEESKKYDLDIVRIINPNVEFSAELLESTIPISQDKQIETPKINMRIESQAIIDPSEIKTIKQLISTDVPEIALILENYKHLPKIF
jgi:glutamate racemase